MRRLSSSQIRTRVSQCGAETTTPPPQTRAARRSKPPGVAAVLGPQQVGGDPQQPRPRGAEVVAVAAAVSERDRERLRREVVGEIAAGAAGDVAVDEGVVAVEDLCEGFGVVQRPRDRGPVLADAAGAWNESHRHVLVISPDVGSRRRPKLAIEMLDELVNQIVTPLRRARGRALRPGGDRRPRAVHGGLARLPRPRAGGQAGRRISARRRRRGRRARAAGRGRRRSGAQGDAAHLDRAARGSSRRRSAWRWSSATPTTTRT